jgi:DNA polymerase-3 subunit delta'
VKPLGQGAELGFAVRQARDLRLPHALRIEGPRGAGKTTTATWIAQALLCPGSGAEPCGSCPTCARVASRNHPDLHWVTLGEDQEEIPVDAVRELEDGLLRLPFEGRARVAVVDPIDLLNEQGQNAILKTVEEPGRHTFLLLPCVRPDALLPTVRSRSPALRVLPLPATVVAEALAARGIDAQTAAWAGEAGQGALGLAADLAASGLFGERHRLVSWWEGSSTESPVGAARALLQGARGRKEAIARIRLLLAVFRHSARLEGRALAGSAAADYRPATCERWPEQIEALFDAETDLDLRIPPEQALIGLLMRLGAA